MQGSSVRSQSASNRTPDKYFEALLQNARPVLHDSEKLTAILSLYHQIHDEIKRYRDLEWQIVAWAVSIITGVIAIARFTSVPIEHRIFVQCLLSLFVIVATLDGLWHLHWVHEKLTFNRNIRRKIERILRFYDEHVYSKESVLPKHWKNEQVPYNKGLTPHLVSFWILILLTALYAMYSIFFVL